MAVVLACATAGFAVKHPQLLALLGHPSESDAPLPSLAAMSFKPPNPDQTRKMCANCALFSSAESTCFIHDSLFRIKPSYWCSYHVFGTPNMQAPRGGMLPVLPEHSRLQPTVHGASCAECRWYESRTGAQGACLAALGARGEAPTVDAQSVCGRWSSVVSQPIA